MFDPLSLNSAVLITRRLLEAIHFQDDKKECSHPDNRKWLDQRSIELAPLVVEVICAKEKDN